VAQQAQQAQQMQQYNRQQATTKAKPVVFRHNAPWGDGTSGTARHSRQRAGVCSEGRDYGVAQHRGNNPGGTANGNSESNLVTWEPDRTNER
jgi:hypothetical protein